METTSVLTMDTTSVLSESKRIIKANRNHFLALSLFFLPFTISFVTGKLFPINQIHHLFYILTVVLIALCGTATITYSAYHAFLGEPLTFSAAFKSLTSSFFPLVWTTIAAHFLLFLVLSTFLSFVGLILWLAQNFGFVVIDSDSMYFIRLSAGVVLVVILICFYVEWSLAFVVVVVESKGGFASLMRSSYLVKGMRSVSLYYGSCCVGMVWMCSFRYYSYMISSGTLLLLGILTTFFMTAFLCSISIANTVVYNYCTILHGELAIEVAQGPVHEYVDLPSDCEKLAPHVAPVFVS